MTTDLHFRWLGTAGIELEFRGERILIDPYLSRFPMRYLIAGRPSSRLDLIKRHLRPARTVLVSHAHFDHLLDVPSVCREFGSTAYGTPNTRTLLRVHGIAPDRIRTVQPGDTFRSGPFEIRILPGRHGRMLGLLPYTGPLPERLTPPLRLSDYRMDGMLSFLIRTEDGSVLVWNGPSEDEVPAADALFYCPLWGARSCARIAKAAGATTVIPVHWDDFFSPLQPSVSPIIVPPGWRSPWIRRMDPKPFAKSVLRFLPDVKVVVPNILEQVEI
jgi:L-ascorbate metabolism protein UlaG (beta-lactamase superfamily)